MKLIECVLNFSEGRDFAKIDAIVHALKRESIAVLHTDIGAAANRTVVTFAGPADAIVQSAFDLTETALSMIDLRTHEGVHPAIGAVDVMPFVPLGNTSMEEC